VDEAELDDLRRVVLSRLTAAEGVTADHPAPPDLRPVIVLRTDGDVPVGAIAQTAGGAESEDSSKRLLVAPLERPRADATTSVEPPDAYRSGPAAGEALDQGRPDEASIAPEAVAIAAGPSSEAADPVVPAPAAKVDPGVPPPAAKARRRRHARSAATPVAPTDRVAATPTVSCPYCAVLLQQPLKTNDRCPRCRQRMIIRSIGGRLAILAQAALPFFEAERLNEERWTRDRDRWLELAHDSGTAGNRMPQLAGELITEADVAAARAWYMSSVDRAFRTAERRRQWEEAARLRYEQAGVLSRIAGTSDPPSDEVVGLHRNGLAADLQAIGEVVKEAEVRGESCCEACRLDDRRVVQIAEELRVPTMPHQGCPNGLCPCRWFLTTRDQEFLAALLRRQMETDRRMLGPTAERGLDDAVSVIS
jgi:hypothetical protein